VTDKAEGYSWLEISVDIKSSLRERGKGDASPSLYDLEKTEKTSRILSLSPD